MLFRSGGAGKQVRDCLHVEDLYRLLTVQMARPEVWDGRVYNVGGGLENSVSLAELTELCRAETGSAPPIDAQPGSSSVDVRIFVTDSSRAESEFRWRPERSPGDIVAEVAAWAAAHRSALEAVL